jgi:hypothetical protein
MGRNTYITAISIISIMALSLKSSQNKDTLHDSYHDNTEIILYITAFSMMPLGIPHR